MHAINKHIFKAKKEKKKGGITAIRVAANRGFMSSVNKPGHGGSHSLHGTLETIEGHRMSLNLEGGKKKVNIVHRGLSLQALTHIRGASRLSKRLQLNEQTSSNT